MMVRKAVLALTFLVATDSRLSAQSKPVWEFYAVQVDRNIGCSTGATIDISHSWIFLNSDVDSARREFTAEVKSKYPKDYVRYALHRRATIGTKLIIAVAKLRNSCRGDGSGVKESLRLFTGPTREDVEAAAAKFRAEYPELQAVDIVQWIDAGAVAEFLTAPPRPDAPPMETNWTREAVDYIKSLVRPTGPFKGPVRTGTFSTCMCVRG